MNFFIDVGSIPQTSVIGLRKFALKGLSNDIEDYDLARCGVLCLRGLRLADTLREWSGQPVESPFDWINL